MISVTARLISFDTAAWPIARPSAKLCRPIPVAIISASRRAGDHSDTRQVAASALDSVPGPKRAWAGGVARAAERTIHIS